MSQEEYNIDSERQTPKKRGRKPGKKRKGYFYEEEEEAFVQYITSKSEKERNLLFNNKLLPAFTKMIESIIRRYDLFTPSEDFSDTFNDTLSFLITKVNNYDITKGHKVYSYCGTICKNYLILKRTNYQKQTEKKIPYDEFYMEDIRSTDDKTSILSWDINTEVINGIIDKLKYMLNEENIVILSKNEQKVGFALLELLTNWEELFKKMGSDKFNKTSVLYFIKEYTLLSTTDIRESSRIFKEIYFSLKEKLLSE